MANNDSDDPEWSCKRHEITYQEARSVLEAQQTIISDLDDKAMRTVRMTVLLVGIVVSVVELGDITISRTPAYIGGISLLLSVLSGMITYSESDLYLGVGSEYLLQLKNESFEDDEDVSWEDHLLVQYSGWIEENARDIRWNGVLLQVTQILLAIGLVLITVAIGL